MKSNKNIFFSIVVPVYNVEKYLKQCVDSILNQTFTDFELILVDDGSSDDSPNICDEYKKKDDRIKVIHQKNSGQVVARKTGLVLAKGDYVQFVDSDDWLELNALEVVAKNIKENNADIVTFDAYFCYNYKKSKVGQSVKAGVYNKKQLKEKIYPKMIYSGNFFYFGIYAAMWNKVFRRSLLFPNMINVDPRLKIGEDGVTTFATFLDAEKIVVLEGVHLYNYRDNNSSITRSYCANQFDNAKLLIETLRKINKQKNVYNLDTQIDYYYMYNIYSIFVEEFYYKYKKKISDKVKYLAKIASDKEVIFIANKMVFKKSDSVYKKFFNYLSLKKISLLIFYSFVLAMKKRLKIFIKKILGRY